jgi:predicted CxxxxCH...CXXCH cytochrome family protein
MMLFHSRLALLLGTIGLLAVGACDAVRPNPDEAAATASDGACTRCHGDPNNGNAAPPRSVRGVTDTLDPAVGAHQSHLQEGPYRRPIACSECHVVPSTDDAPGHMDQPRAPVSFGPLASSGGAHPQWNPAQATCSSTYCHGTTLGAGGSNPTPAWTGAFAVGSTTLACDACHAVPPPTSTGHPSVTGGVTACAGCHADTVNPDGTINTAGGKHINGVVDAPGLPSQPPPSTLDGAALYASTCAGCHGPLATSSKKGASAAMIQAGIDGNFGGMGAFSTLTAAQLQAIADALATTAPPPPPPTTLDGAALYASTCAGCHGPLATSAKRGRTAAQITAANMTKGLSAAQVQAVAGALATTAPPPPPAACTYSYNTWGACQPGNTQSRTVASASPAGCSGTPVLSQACTYVPPPPGTCTYAYSAWGTCQSNSTQTRTVVSASPAGCTGTPSLTQSCTPPPPAIDGAALYASTCAGCHGPLATSSKRGRTAAQITAANMTKGLSAAQVQAVANALNF